MQIDMMIVNMTPPPPSTPPPPLTPLDDAARRRIVDYLIETLKEVSRLNEEIKELEPHIDGDKEAYKKYKLKIGARDEMIQQIRDCEEALRSI
jgi:DNA primase catalytic subunit